MTFKAKSRVGDIYNGEELGFCFLFEPLSPHLAHVIYIWSWEMPIAGLRNKEIVSYL